jgi:putative thioredoxin
MVSNPGLNRALRGAVDLSSLVAKSQAPSTAPGDSEGIVREVDDRTIGALIEMSRQIPVILEIYGGALTPTLGPLIESYQGAFILGTVRGEQAPELVQALNVEGIPTVVAVVGGQPVPLFQGIPPEPEIRAVLDQVLELAKKSGVNGVVAVSTGSDVAEESEATLPPLHQEAYDALHNNDVAGAVAAFEKAIAQNPSDHEAEAGLAQVKLLERTQGLDAVAARQRVAEHPEDVVAALVVADLDMSGGHVEDATTRLLNLFVSADPEARDVIRTRLLAYFLIAGPQSEVVKKARTRLASLMF